MKQTTKAMLIGCFLGSMLTVGGLAAALQNEDITALLNRQVAIKYNGEVVETKDANGTRVYPLTYNGTTYLPVRAVAGLFGIKVDWDGANNTVLLGENSPVEVENPPAPTAEPDLPAESQPADLLLRTPTAQSGTVSRKSGITLDGTAYKDYLYLDTRSGSVSYDLGGAYSRLALSIYGKAGGGLQVLGDGRVLATVEFGEDSMGMMMPDVRGVQQLTIKGVASGSAGEAYIVRAELLA